MDKYRIIDEMSRNRVVERIVENIARQSMSPELKDLSQMVYLILLEYDEEKIADLWMNDQMNFFVVRIVLNQFHSSNSPFHKLYRKYQLKSMDITEYDCIDNAD